VCEQISSITAQSRTVGLLSIPYQTLWEQAQLYVSACNIVTHDTKALNSSQEEKVMRGKHTELWRIHTGHFQLCALWLHLFTADIHSMNGVGMGCNNHAFGRLGAKEL
jgi:hypothetical protein